MTSPISAAILNGGRARRMEGRDKSALLVGGRSILERQREVLGAFGALAMVGGEPPEGLVPLRDACGGLGPLDGLASALRWCPTDWLLVVASDQPGLQSPLLELLADARQDHDDAVVARIRAAVQPFPGLYHRRILPTVGDFIRRRRLRLRELLEESSPLRVRFVSENACRGADPRLASFVNLNRPEDLLQEGKGIL